MNKFSSLINELFERDIILISGFEEQCATFGYEIISTSSADDIKTRLFPSEDEYSIF